MSKKDNNSLTWETKCRRCGHLTEWYFGPRDFTKYDDFVQSMIDKVVSPRLEHCAKCKKHTVQDVVSYSSHQ